MRDIRTMFRKFRVILIGAVLCIAAGCIFGNRAKDYNVLFITIDTLRADHLSCYGYSRNTSPNLDQFAKTGVLFRKAYCQMPTTGPSHASIFASKYPRKLGLLKNGWVLSANPLLLPEILKKHGYLTGAIVSSFVLDPRFGFNRGFDEYDAHFNNAGSSKTGEIIWEGHVVTDGFDQRANLATEKAIRWVDKHLKTKFFLWVHYFDPHTPYSPPEPYAKSFLNEGGGPLEKRIARYDGEILFVDEQIGRLLHYLQDAGINSKTLIVIMADHGEGLGQHNWLEHGVYLYEEATHIPLMVSLPGVIPQGIEVDSIVQSIDIAPTILDILKIKQDPQYEGESLFPMTLNSAQRKNRTVFMERRHYEKSVYQGVRVSGQKYGVREGDWKYIWAPQESTEELYNLTQDPKELVNIIDRNQDLASKLQEMIKKWKQDQDTGHTETQTIDPETQEKLKSLGYVN
jgi:arylsulfatase A-like enzyme